MQGIPDGVDGTRATLRVMSELVRMGRTALPVRIKAMELVRDLPQKAYLDEIRTVHKFVRDHIRYLKDVRAVETVTTAEKILELGQGDCDDKSVLTAALLESIGHPTRLVAVGCRANDYAHVLVETRVGANKWIPVETTEPVDVGWYPPGWNYRLVCHVHGGRNNGKVKR